MSHSIQFQLETMLPELISCLENSFISLNEQKSIIKKRTFFEQLVHKRVKLIHDYLDYLVYEDQLLQLFKLRQSKNDLKLLPIQKQVARIHGIYSRCFRKFNNLELYDLYFSFCKSTESNKTLGATYAKAIQCHPTNPDIWCNAANWEIETNLNMDAARSLLQRGIRINNESREIWICYFKLELEYNIKLLDRKNILGLNQDDVSLTVLKNFEIPRLVYQEAISIIKDLEFKKMLLDLLDSFDGDYEQLYCVIYDSLDASIECISVLCQRHVRNINPNSQKFPSQLQKTVQEYSTHLLSSPKLIIELIKFMDEIHSKTSSKLQDYISSIILKSCNIAQDSCTITPPIYKIWQKYTSSSVYSRSILLFPNETDLWVEHLKSTNELEVEFKNASSNKINLDVISSIYFSICEINHTNFISFFKSSMFQGFIIPYLERIPDYIELYKIIEKIRPVDIAVLEYVLKRGVGEGFNVKDLFEVAIQKGCKVEDEYRDFLISMGDIEGASMVEWRREKSMAN